jgi:uncharacterized repeat protein (TIGR01451 family)
MRRLVTAAAAALVLALPATAAAQAEPPAAKSQNVTWKTTLPEPNGISANFHGNLMYLSTTRGLAIYDITQPDAPVRLSFFALPHFENEDVDTNGQILLISNDPSEGKGILYILDVRDPRAPKLLSTLDTGAIESFGLLPTHTGTGHTATCIQDCRYVYLAGTDKGIDIVDLTNPAAPVIAGNFPATEATGLSSHDVQVDGTGLAWLAGYNGTAAYDTTDPLHPKLVYHTDDKGKSDYGDNPANDGSTLNDFIHHNSNRLNWGDLAAAPAGSDPHGESDVVAITEEDYSRPTCQGAGQFETWKIGDGGILHNLDSFSVEVDPSRTALCSAHYFDVRDGLVGQAWYEAGTRFLDVTDPSNIRQVGYWIPSKNVTWSVYYPPTDPTGQIAYSIDTTRGVDVIKIDRGAAPDTSTPPPGGTTISGSGGDKVPAQRAPNIGLRLGDRRGLVKPGDTLTYKLSLHNSGRATANGIAVTVDLPKGLNRVRGGRRRARGRQVAFTVKSLRSKRNKQLKLVTRVSRRTKVTQLEVSAVATVDRDLNPRDNYAVDRNRVKLPEKKQGRAARRASSRGGAARTARMATVIAPPISDTSVRAWGYRFSALCRIALSS